MKNFLNMLNERFFSSAYQVQRIVILTGILLAAALISFGGYYYYDRYYTSQAPIAQMTVAEAEQAVLNDPENPDARIGLAEAYMLTGRFEDAITQALQVSQSHPEDIRADFVLGISYANSGKPQQALEPLQKFIDSQKDTEMPGLNKQLQAALYYLGDSYLQLGQPQAAIEPLGIAVNLSQTDADAIYKLGLAFYGMQDFPNAILAFQDATRFVPNFTEAYDALARAYDATRQTDLADYARGMVAYSQKDYQTALGLLQKSAQARPGEAQIFAGLGMTYEAMGDLPNAKAAYDTAVLLDPANYAATQGAQRVDIALKP
jgi:tetratricopeptide (TPR) repeat protein